MAVNFLKIRTGASLRPNTAPGTPENGDIYYDSGTNLFNFYQNGAFVTLPSSGAANTALSNLASVAINISLLPGTDNSINLGSASFRWSNVHALNHLFYGSTSGALTMSAAATTTSYSLIWPAAQAPAAGYILSNDGSGNLSWVNAPSIVPKWTQIILTSASFSAAANTNDISLIVLPARTLLHQIVIKHSAPASGAGLTAYTLSVGLATNFVQYVQPFDVQQAVSQTGKTITQIEDIPNFGSTQDVRIQAISAGNTLNNVTSGTFFVWIQTSVLP